MSPNPVVVVIGASAGGVNALLQICRALPAGFPAPVCIVQHVGNYPSVLPQLLGHHGSNPSVHVEDGQQLAASTLHVAPPDRHMLLIGDVLRLTRGPKENHARPAIDPLFRSAALSCGERLIGVILTGQMDDGAAGLKAIKDHGGIVIVQDPETAAEPEMPRNALASVEADHCVALEEIAPLLVRLVAARMPRPAVPATAELALEVDINAGESTTDNLLAIASPSLLTCPDCGGALAEVKARPPLRYRCHTGHAFTAETLSELQKDAAEQAVWGAVRALREREMLLRRLADIARTTGDHAQAAAGVAQADRLLARIQAIRDAADGAPHVLQIDEAPA